MLTLPPEPDVSQASGRRTRLGDWTFPSGQTMVCDLEPAQRDGLRMARCVWDSPPPLPPDDHLYYLAVVRPALIRLAQEYLEAPGKVTVLTA